MDAVVGERGEYMAKGHVFITSPLSIIQSAILCYNMRGYLIRVGNIREGWGKGGRGEDKQGGPSSLVCKDFKLIWTKGSIYSGPNIVNRILVNMSVCRRLFHVIRDSNNS